MPKQPLQHPIIHLSIFRVTHIIEMSGPLAAIAPDFGNRCVYSGWAQMSPFVRRLDTCVRCVFRFEDGARRCLKVSHPVVDDFFLHLDYITDIRVGNLFEQSFLPT